MRVPGELLHRPSSVVIIKLIICLRVPRGNYNSDFVRSADVEDGVADADAKANANAIANVDDYVHE